MEEEDFRFNGFFLSKSNDLEFTQDKNDISIRNKTREVHFPLS
jgi:hypothetical protein